MIRAWLANRAGVTSLIERVATLEHELSETRATVLSLNERLAATDARGAAAHDRLDHQLRALVRAVRAGTVRLRHVQARGLDQAARDEEVRDALERLDAAIAIVGARIDAEAEQVRRGTIGLFDAIERMRRSA